MLLVNLAYIFLFITFGYLFLYVIGSNSSLKGITGLCAITLGLFILSELMPPSDGTQAKTLAGVSIQVESISSQSVILESVSEEIITKPNRCTRVAGMMSYEPIQYDCIKKFRKINGSFAKVATMPNGTKILVNSSLEPLLIEIN